MNGPLYDRDDWAFCSERSAFWVKQTLGKATMANFKMVGESSLTLTSLRAANHPDDGGQLALLMPNRCQVVEYCTRITSTSATCMAAQQM